MNRLLIAFLFSVLFFSCKSDKQRIEDAKQVVTTFVKDLELENLESANKSYPSFPNIGKYWILNSFIITATKIDNREVTIYGKFKKGGEIDDAIMFVLKEDNNRNYVIDHSKGLSAFYGSYEYIFFKNINCLQGIETDQQISQACQSRINKYNSFVSQTKESIEKSINDQLVFVNEESDYLGNKYQNWKLVNKNGFLEIPIDSYEIDMQEVYWVGDKIQFTGNFKINTSGTPLLYNSSTSFSLISPPEYHLSYPHFKITDTEFIKKFITQFPSSYLDCSAFDKMTN